MTAPTVKLSSLRANSALERAGDWIESTSIPGVSFKVRSINYPPYTVARNMLFQRLRRKYGAKTPEDVMTSELGKLYAEYLLLDWKGLDEPYSADQAMAVLSDPEFRDVVAAVEAAAGEVGQPEIEFVEDTTKNSGAPSAGS
jgi:hypothetical protein